MRFFSLVKKKIKLHSKIEQNHFDFLLVTWKQFLFLAGLGFGLGGSQGGKAASLGDLLLTFLFGLLYNRARAHTHTNTCKYLLKGENSTPSHSFKHMYGSKVRSSCRGSEKAAALIISYLQPLGQQLGILRSFVLVLLRALSLKGDAAAFVLQHTGCHQALDFRGLGPGLLA